MRHHRQKLILQAIRFLGAGARRVLALEELLARLLQPRHVRERTREALLLGRERVLRFARHRQRLDRFVVQLPRFGDVPLLILETAHHDLIRAIREVDRREHQNRLPVFAAIDHDRSSGARGPRDHEAGCAPPELVAPHLPPRALRGQRNRTGHQPGIDRELRGDGPDERLRQR